MNTEKTKIMVTDKERKEILHVGGYVGYVTVGLGQSELRFLTGVVDCYFSACVWCWSDRRRKLRWMVE